MSLADELRHDVAGIKLLADWLGDGGQPVSKIHAEHRGYACTHGDSGSPCKFNIEPNWWDRHVKEPIAATIKAQLELKHKLSLRLSSDDSLNMCQKCGCALPLKCWVPSGHVKAHTNLIEFQDAPSFCWIKKELSTSEP